MTRKADIRIARAYDDPTSSDGARLLVDRLWPRGVAKSDLHHDDWLRQIGPSDELRKWFGHDPAKWGEFRNRYMSELKDSTDDVETCLDWVSKGTVTLIYAAKDRDHNNAVVLRDYLNLILQNKNSGT